jgi:hypothetical protein
MNMLLEISAGSGFLHVCAKGRFSLPDAKRTFLEMLEAVAQHEFDKVLFDGRSLAGSPTIMERFYYGEFAAQSVANYTARGVPRATRFAYVLVIPMLDPARFGETVAVNRGMLVRTFENPEDALGWLDIAPNGDISLGAGES